MSDMSTYRTSIIDELEDCVDMIKNADPHKMCYPSWGYSFLDKIAGSTVMGHIDDYSYSGIDSDTFKRFLER